MAFRGNGGKITLATNRIVLSSFIL
jgi:hypothetical protein